MHRLFKAVLEIVFVVVAQEVILGPFECESLHNLCNDKRWRLNRNLEWRNQSSE